MGQTSRTELDESTLISRAARGQAEAFGRLYDRHVRALFRHIHYLTNDSQQAEELTAQTFITAAEAIGSYEMSEGPFLTWLLRISHELTANLDAIPRHDNSHLQPGETGVAREATFSLDGERTPDGLRRLPADQRHVIVMRFIDGLSETDIARVTRKSVGKVRMIQLPAL